MQEIRRRVRVIRLYSHDLSTIPAVELEPGDRIDLLDRRCNDLLLDVHPVDTAEDRGRLDRDEKCFVGWSAGRASHFSWVQDRGVHDIRGTWRQETIQPGDFWIYSCRTAERARGRRLYPAALATILRHYKRQQYRRALIYVADGNISSINGIERAGFVMTARIRSLAWRRSLLWLPGSSSRTRSGPVMSRRALETRGHASGE
jgi:hypothetical protein